MRGSDSMGWCCAPGDGAWYRTVHNFPSHSSVFANDIAVRRIRVTVSDLVLLHSRSALASLAAYGAEPRKSVIIPHGPLAPVVPRCGDSRHRMGLRNVRG